MDEFERALAFIEDLEERSATRIESFSWGRGFFNDDLPAVWDMNFARVEREPDSWRDLEREVDELQGRGGLAHRKMLLRDERWVPALRDEARGRGWEATSLIFMARTGEGDKTNGGRAREVDYPEMRKLRSLLSHRQPWAGSDDDVRQILDANRKWMKLVGGRYFGAEADGRLVAAADLYLGPGLAQVEDVETMKEYQGRGYGTDVVLEAVETARREAPDAFVFLIADENDWPKVLYERLGFETVGRRHSILRLPKRT
jgi:ribosomal protein S18 acetylase RimI-like enzyme